MGHFSGFTCKLFRCCHGSIQVIGDLLGNRKFLIRGSLIVNVAALCIPCHLAAVLSKSLIALHVCDISQVRCIFDGILIVVVYQVVGYNDFLRISNTVGNNIYRLIFSDIFLANL